MFTGRLNILLQMDLAKKTKRYPNAKISTKREYLFLHSVAKVYHLKEKV